MENILMLRDSKAEIVKLQGVINQFIKSCSHSMRGPLKSIEGLVGLLQNFSCHSEKEIEIFLRLIVTNTLKMEHMLNEMEHFLENSKRDITYTSVNLSPLISEILSELNADLKHHNIETNVQIDQNIDLYSDKNRIKMVLTKIINNSIIFHDDSKKNKNITIHANINFSSCSISISDNGVGIESQYQENTFQLFFRGSEKSQGSGMGLYIVRETIEKMGGSITMESKYGEGSKFILWFPNQNLTKNSSAQKHSFTPKDVL